MASLLGGIPSSLTLTNSKKSVEIVASLVIRCSHAELPAQAMTLRSEDVLLAADANPKVAHDLEFPFTVIGFGRSWSSVIASHGSYICN